MVYSVDVYDKSGKVVSKFDFNGEIFAPEKVNESLIHEYLLLQTANARNVIASTKTRAEVSGSGKAMTKKSRKLALNGLLTLKLQQNIISGLDVDSMEPNTKSALNLLEKMGKAGKKVLLVLDKKDDGIVKSFRNIEGLKYLLVDYLNPFDLMNADAIVFLKPALDFVNQA